MYVCVRERVCVCICDINSCLCLCLQIMWFLKVHICYTNVRPEISVFLPLQMTNGGVE